MPKTHFVADTHWAHQAVLGLRLGLNRPFATIEEHDEALIANWNAAVGREDTVWHLGDFCYRCPEPRAREIFARLNGRRRFLVRGNHDKIGSRLPWDGVVDVARVLVPLPDGTVQGIWCSHYAHRVWPGQHRGVTVHGPHRSACSHRSD